MDPRPESARRDGARRDGVWSDDARRDDARRTGVRPDDAQPDRAVGVWRAIPWSLRYAAVAAGCALLIAGAVHLALRLAVLVAPLTLAVFAALLLTALLQPLTELLTRRRVPRAVGALVAVLMVPLMLVAPALLFWPMISKQTEELPEQLAQGWSRTRDWLTGAVGVSDQQLDGVIDRVTERASQATANPTASAMGLVEALGAALLALILMFFLLKDGPVMARWFGARFPGGERGRWASAAGSGWQALARYARGTVVVAAVDAIGIGAALLVIGVPLALPLALLTFLAAFVPIIGATVAGVVATLVALAAGGPVDALLVLAAVITVQQLEGNLLEPLIMGRALRLHPAVVLVAVTAGALTGGVAGALVAVPLTAVTYRVVRTLHEHRPDVRGEQDAGLTRASQPSTLS